MTVEIPRPPLKGKKALVAGIANEYSIAYGCAKAFRELEADLAITYLNDKAKPYVEPLAQALEAPIFMPLDVSQPGQLEALFSAIGAAMGAARHPGPLHCLRTQGRSAGRFARLLGRWLCPGNGYLLPLVHPHGAPRRTADDRGRGHVRNDLPWR